MSSIVIPFHNKLHISIVLNYYLKNTFHGLKADFCLNVSLIQLPKSHGKRAGLVGRCLRDNRGLSQSLKEGDNTCRLQSKSPFTVGMECVTKAVMQLSVCMFILLPTLNATLFRPLGEH